MKLENFGENRKTKGGRTEEEMEEMEKELLTLESK